MTRAELRRQWNRRDAERESMTTAQTKPIDALVRELKETREQISALKKQEEKARELLLPLLDVMGGTYTDEVSGLTASIERSPRYEWDAQKLFKLKTDGLITGNEYADLLETIVKKDAVQALVDSGKITDRQLAGVGAKRVTKLVETVTVKEAKR
jgi:ribosomal protein L19E